MTKIRDYGSIYRRGNFDVFGLVKINLGVKSPKVALSIYTRGTELSIEYETVVYGLAQFIIIEFLYNCIEELIVVSAGEQPAGAKVSLLTF